MCCPPKNKMKTKRTSEYAWFGIVASGVSPDVEGAHLAARLDAVLKSDVAFKIRLENFQAFSAGLEATALRQAGRLTLQRDALSLRAAMVCYPTLNVGQVAVPVCI
jgi:hypothetical protein